MCGWLISFHVSVGGVSASGVERERERVLGVQGWFNDMQGYYNYRFKIQYWFRGLEQPCSIL